MFHLNFIKFFRNSYLAGERPLPIVRIEEIIYVLQELARLVIHPDTASALLLPPFLKEGISKNENCNGRAHLFCLFPSFCELVVSRSVPKNFLLLLLLFLKIHRELFLAQMCIPSMKRKTKKSRG